MSKALFAILLPVLLQVLVPIILVGCAPEANKSIEEHNQQDLIERPNAAAAIISRDLPFQEDHRISYCETLSTNNNSYSGFRDQQLLPLASLSKLITTAWALKKLGPDYSFQSDWHLKPVVNQLGVVDAYLKSNYDPVFNIEKILYSLSLLNKNGVVKIRNLVIDETTRIYLSALTQPHIELEQVPISSNESIENLKLILNSENWSTQTLAAKHRLLAWAGNNNKTLSIPDFFSVETVTFKNSNTVDLSFYSQRLSFKSSNLLKYLKNLNVFSNNYISDYLFWLLGGSKQFLVFQAAELKLKQSQLQIFTGSGLAEIIHGVRKDNLGTCTSMLKVLNYLDLQAQKLELNLGHILYNPTQDLGGTYESDLNFNSQVVLKTGRLFENPAINVAGISTLQNSSLYFVFLGHNFSAGEAKEIETARDQMLQSALNFYPLKNSILTLPDYQIFLR